MIFAQWDTEGGLDLHTFDVLDPLSCFAFHCTEHYCIFSKIFGDDHNTSHTMLIIWN